MDIQKSINATKKGFEDESIEYGYEKIVYSS